jgi:hypothetical protein
MRGGWSTKKPLSPGPHPALLRDGNAVLASAGNIDDIRVEAGDAAGTASIAGGIKYMTKDDKI